MSFLIISRVDYRTPLTFLFLVQHGLSSIAWNSAAHSAARSVMFMFSEDPSFCVEIPSCSYWKHGFFRLGMGSIAVIIPTSLFPLFFCSAQRVGIYHVIFTSLFCSTIHFDGAQVREIVSILDLDVLYYPCPRNSPQFRLKVLQIGGKQQFPYMVGFLNHYLGLFFEI